MGSSRSLLQRISATSGLHVVSHAHQHRAGARPGSLRRAPPTESGASRSESRTALHQPGSTQSRLDEATSPVQIDPEDSSEEGGIRREPSLEATR